VDPKSQAKLEKAEAKLLRQSKRGRSLLQMSPLEMVQELTDFLYAWRRTRNWKAILAIVPPLILLFSLGGFVLAGRLRSKESLLQWYEAKANEALGFTEDGKPVVDENGEPKKRSPEDDAKADLLFKRILQLGGNSQNATFFVALRNSQNGRTGVARSMMETIAPKDRPGFGFAHAWLAEDMIRRASAGETISPQELMHHFANSLEKSDVNFPANLYLVYAQLLEQSKRFDDASRVLMRGAEAAPELRLEPIALYLRNNMATPASNVADQIIANMRGRLQKPGLTEVDKEQCSLTIARALQLTNRTDDSIPVLERALAENPRSLELRRALSDAYRVKFRLSLAKTSGKAQVNMDFLNRAIAIDPTNIAIQSDLSILGQLGVSSGDENRARLSTLIAKEGASFSARMLLAEASIGIGDLNSAIIQYEVILAELPNMTLALNNLAMLMTQIQPPDTDKAREYIQKAIELTPQVAEFLDTKGDIEALAKRPDTAIEAYLACLERSPERTATRKKLIQIYRDQNKNEDADKQSEILTSVEARIKAIQEQWSKANAAAPKPGEAKAASEPANQPETTKPEPERNPPADDANKPAESKLP
jgi:tetratricopeptide (TPR) repeat protein